MKRIIAKKEKGRVSVLKRNLLKLLDDEYTLVRFFESPEQVVLVASKGDDHKYARLEALIQYIDLKSPNSKYIYLGRDTKGKYKTFKNTNGVSNGENVTENEITARQNLVTLLSGDVEKVIFSSSDLEMSHKSSIEEVRGLLGLNELTYSVVAIDEIEVEALSTESFRLYERATVVSELRLDQVRYIARGAVFSLMFIAGLITVLNLIRPTVEEDKVEIKNDYVSYQNQFIGTPLVTGLTEIEKLYTSLKALSGISVDNISFSKGRTEANVNEISKISLGSLKSMVDQVSAIKWNLAPKPFITLTEPIDRTDVINFDGAYSWDVERVYVALVTSADAIPNTKVSLKDIGTIDKAKILQVEMVAKKWSIAELQYFNGLVARSPIYLTHADIKFRNESMDITMKIKIIGGKNEIYSK
ncbi:hypothetical protein AB6E94_19745 [Vibrio lentus]|uniref:hypothetical protein n=1 Tax=Vibrio splendidus TaxID=29497 RepID=UPI000C842C28|nr:hypothetical protein [Vibrio splendidus]PMG17940.1 hypothetical protein BCU98_00980 [Vibrio splendidus]